MTKRAYPFEVGVLRQFKVHVNNFEFDKASLKDIQNKTVEKLFSAQKNPVPLNMNNNNIQDLKEKNVLQKRITNYFQYDSPNEDKMDNNQMNCSQGTSYCSYCDNQFDTVYECRLCEDMFCSSCSFAYYKMGCSEDRICMSCS